MDDRVIEEINSRVEDARYAMLNKLHILKGVIVSIERTIEHNRTLNAFGEIQGEASKLDACIARYVEALKMRDVVLKERE